MKKIKYTLKRIVNINYKNFFKTINYVSKKSKKSRVFIFFDMIYTGIKYQAGYMDYKLFEMYKMNNKEKATIITRGVNNNYIRILNKKEDMKLLNNKLLFNEKFKKYLNRDYIAIDKDKYEEYLSFVNKHKTFIAKPIDQSCGTDIEIIKVNKDNKKEIFESLINKKQLLLEEIAVQRKELSMLHKTSINTVRVVTIGGEVVAAFLRIGNNNNVVDNFNHGGMCAPINIKTGKIEFPAIDKKENLYYKHPITNKEIVGLEIPLWNQIKKLCKDASKLIPTLKLVGWDVCVGEKVPLLIEANEFPGHDVYQLPPHRNGNIGLKPVFDEAINKLKN